MMEKAYLSSGTYPVSLGRGQEIVDEREFHVLLKQHNRKRNEGLVYRKTFLVSR